MGHSHNLSGDWVTWGAQGVPWKGMNLVRVGDGTDGGHRAGMEQRQDLGGH